MAADAEACAITLRIIVVHSLAGPGHKTGVAGIATHAGTGKQLRFIRNVVRRRSLGTNGYITAVVTGLALAGDTDGNVFHAGPYGCTQMAGVALRRGRYMEGRFRLCILRQIATVMAGRALACESGMVHARQGRPGEIPSGVAEIALLRGGNMGGGLGLRVLRKISARMAGGALPGLPRMIHVRQRHGPVGEPGLVAGGAIRRGRNMGDTLGICVGKGVGGVVAARAHRHAGAAGYVVHRGLDRLATWSIGVLIGLKRVV